MDTPRIADLASQVVSRLPPGLGGRPDRRVVSLVRLHGVITPVAGPVPRAVINAAAVEKVLERAFAPDRLAAVALLVNSPGGAATQSALVADRVRSLAAERDVPVLAFCEDVAASGGFWLACAADEIYAHPTSMIGSIGVVSAGFGLEGLLQRLGVERRVHTVGRFKTRLDPYLPESAEDVEWLRGLQEQIHETFQRWVTERRGDRLAAGADVFTGEVWTGTRAVELGLVDGLGTARGVLTERFPDARLHPVENRRPVLARLGVAPAAFSAADSLLGLAQAADVRAAWARYGL